MIVVYRKKQTAYRHTYLATISSQYCVSAEVPNETVPLCDIFFSMVVVLLRRSPEIFGRIPTIWRHARVRNPRV